MVRLLPKLVLCKTKLPNYILPSAVAFEEYTVNNKTGL